MGKKKISTGVWLLGLLIVFCSYTGVAGAKNRSKTKTVTKSVPLGDPFILLHDGTYYAYGTHAADGIEVYTSKDLRKWKLHGLAKMMFGRIAASGHRRFTRLTGSFICIIR